VLNSRSVVFLGLIRYSVYLWQQLLLKNPFSPSSITRLPVNLVLVEIVATTSYYVVERPVLRLRQRLEARIFDRPENAQPGRRPSLSGG